MAKAMQVMADFEKVMSEEEKKGWENCLDELDEPEIRLAKDAMGKYLVNKEWLRGKNPAMIMGMYYLDSNWDNFCGLIRKDIAESQRARTAIGPMGPTRASKSPPLFLNHGPRGFEFLSLLCLQPQKVERGP